MWRDTRRQVGRRSRRFLVGFAAAGALIGRCAITAAAEAPTPAGILTADIDEGRVVDLTYPFDARTVYWPTATPFRMNEVARGRTEGGYWYAANEFCTAEHGGTHLDAPIHFAEKGWSADQIPVARLIGSAVVVDIRSRAAVNSDAELTVEDLATWERVHGRIPAGAIVVLYAGWGARWPDRARYLGSAEPRDTTNLHFPGFSRSAAEFLVREREIDAVGTDTASIDPGPSRDFAAHRVFGAANVPALENLAALERLPAAGATLVALPMKIGGGTGGPARVVAILP
jgi:kynurenine formamidase